MKTVLVLGMLLCSIVAYADDSVLPINLQPTPPPSTTTDSPQTPFVTSISAYYDGHYVVVTSQVDMMAQIRIFETESGQSLYDQTVCLAPQWSCPIYVTGVMLTLQVICDGTIYEGTFIN